MIDLDTLDIDELAVALEDQTDYEHRWLMDPRTGQLIVWTSDTGIDGHHPVDIDDLDLLPVEPIPSGVWFQDMVDFAEGISDVAAGRQLAEALRGRGAFRRFKDRVYNHPELVAPWQALHDARARRRAVEWLAQQQLITAHASAALRRQPPRPGAPVTEREASPSSPQDRTHLSMSGRGNYSRWRF